MSRIGALILDFDGVLVESNAIKDAAFAEFFALYRAHEEELVAFHVANHSLPRRDKFAYAAELMGHSGDDNFIDEMSGRFSVMLRQQVIACPVVPGAIEFLKEYEPLVPLYISSVTPQQELEAILAARGMDIFIKTAYGNPPIPKGEAIAHVLELEGVEAHEVLFIGDSQSDYEVARAAGLVFWGRDSGQPFDIPESVELFSDLVPMSKKLRSMI